MTVQELMKELRKMPKNAEVYLCKDWEMLDDGLDFVDIDEVILCFDEERAK